jgi:DNA-binding NarL/FixJ family response regulator
MGDRAPIRVLLADDHEIVRKGIRDFLEEEEDLQVIAEAADGERALQLMQELHPDVAVLDIQMPKLTGIQVAEKGHTTCPDVKVLILTAYDYDPYVFAALRSGASGYIMKTARSHELAQAVRTVHNGGSALDPHVTRRVVEHMTSGSPYSRGEGMIEHPSARWTSCAWWCAGSAIATSPTRWASATALCKDTWPTCSAKWRSTAGRRRPCWPSN